MPSTFSQNLRLELIGAGEQSGTWNVTTNNNLGDLIEQAISGATDLDVSVSNITLTALNGVSDQARSAVLAVTGTPGTTRTITIPNVSKTYTVKNRSDATVDVKTASGDAFSIPTLAEAYIYCDGENVITGRVITDNANAFNATPNPLNNLALTGTPTAPTAPVATNNTQIATTAFVRSIIPAGVIMMWSGSVATIPAGWHLCLRGDSMVLMADGTERSIQELVETRSTEEVMAFDPATNRLVPKKIVDWYENPVTDRNDWVSLKAKRRDIKRAVWVTKDHGIWTDTRGYVKAEDLSPNDVGRVANRNLSSLGLDAVAGMLMGDGSLDRRGQFRHSQSEDRKGYSEWLAEVFESSLRVHQSAAGWSNEESKQYSIAKCISSEAPSLQRFFGKKKKDRFSRLGLVGLAFMYMDDGSYANKDNGDAATFHCLSFDPDQIVEMLESHGYSCRVHKHNLTDGYYVRLTTESSWAFWKDVAKYIHPACRYKIPEKLHEEPFVLRKEDFWVDSATSASNIESRAWATFSQGKRNNRLFDTRYDIKVDGLSSFVANGLVVHNCDGANGTPDLRNRFIVGAGSSYSPGNTGGADSVTLSTSQIPSHSHSGSSNSVSLAHTHSFSATSGNAGGHNHTGTTSSVNLNHTHSGTTGNAGGHNHTGTTSSANLAHTHSGTTGNNNVGHTHTFSASTNNVNLSHSHGVNDPGHNHAYSQAAAISPAGGGSLGGGDGNLNTSIAFNIPSKTTGISINNALGNHAHSVSGTTSGISANHNHSFTTGAMSANASHSHSFTTSSVSNHNHSFTTGTMSANASHDHSFTTSTQSDHNHSVSGTTGGMSANQSHSHSISIGNTGGGNAHENRPPYFALAYIMKS